MRACMHEPSFQVVSFLLVTFKGLPVTWRVKSCSLPMIDVAVFPWTLDYLIDVFMQATLLYCIGKGKGVGYVKRIQGYTVINALDPQLNYLLASTIVSIMKRVLHF